MAPMPKWLAFAVVGAMVLLAVMLSNQDFETATIAEVPYSTFKQLVADGEVDSVTLQGEAATAVLKRARTIAGAPAPTTEIMTRIPAFGDPALLPSLDAQDVTYRSLPTAESGSGRWFLVLLPWLLLLGFYWWYWGRMSKTLMGRMGGAGIGDFLTGASRKQAKDAPRITFDDVAGQDNAKREVAELVDFLRDPARYTRLGAEAPRGVLLIGPPGTGKTLLARALAGEAKVPFFHTSASEFIEMFVGVGASRVRQMFDEAKKRAPAIIFMDELDSVGRVRGAGLGGGHDEREQTLNQILAEMDGFAGHEAVIVLAATNRPDVLDPALLRPGRFDRHVTLELPDKDARKAILVVHTAKMPLGPDVDLDAIAAGTPGFSGADLKNLANEAAMAAARDGADKIAMRQFEDMRDKVMMGSVRTLAIQPDEHHRLAVHEAGHTAVAYYLPEADPLYKVTIIPRGRALGSTHMLPEQERHTLPEPYLKDRLAVMLAGRIAEKIILGSTSSGADDDIRQASQLARAMVARWGMSEAVGPVDLRQSDEHPFLGREIAQPRRFSETTAHEVDQGVAALLEEAEARAGDVLGAHRREFGVLVAGLERNESLDRAQIDACLGSAPEPVADLDADRDP
ncbi:MAG: ATP-dependent zinc metalloprotease FtsH [Alphaproteobacteria bacterium]|jgi:cell division protease FtsH|nr:ATP-dependent zinc metalloprotease FtsH [Alphaproteobacteria bacterium]MDP6515376.1 ATP-dependent zinc metalloprotease FtsH [Alphaproteobacteria bacterium]